MITTEEVTKVAKLMKLRFSADEITNFTKDLTGIMEMIDELNEVNCEGVEPLLSVCDATQRLRIDQITCEDISDEVLANTSGEHADFAKHVKCFVVPKVVE